MPGSVDNSIRISQAFSKLASRNLRDESPSFATQQSTVVTMSVKEGAVVALLSSAAAMPMLVLGLTWSALLLSCTLPVVLLFALPRLDLSIS